VIDGKLAAAIGLLEAALQAGMLRIPQPGLGDRSLSDG
jgi:hypothetical protein